MRKVLIVMLLLLLSLTVQAQGTTPTPRPTLAIDLGSSATPSVQTNDDRARIAELDNLALQQEELPGNGALSVANPDNGTKTIVELAVQWANIAPTLAVKYANNGVIAVNLSEYTAQNCGQLAVYGLGSWLRLFTDETSAQGLLVDPTVTAQYGLELKWALVSETTLTSGNLYSVADNGAVCEGTRYLFEYPYGRYVVGVIVYAADDVPFSTVQGIIRSLSGVLNGRIDAFEGAPQAAVTPIVIRTQIPPMSSAITNVILTPPPVIGVAQAYILDTKQSLLPFTQTGGITNPSLYVRNPVDATRAVIADAIGLLFTMKNNQPARLNVTPFNDFIPPTRSQNDDLVTDAAWSLDGQMVAFVIDSTGNEVRSPDAGVWVFQPDRTPPMQLLIDCPPGCEIVTRFDDPREYTAKSVVWSPDSQWLLVSIYIPATDRNGLIVFPRLNGETIRNIRPPVFHYDYGDWALDGRLVVSGRSGENARVILGFVNRDNSGLQVVLDGSAQGLWLQNGTQRPQDNQAYSGELMALCREGDGNGAMWLCAQDGTKITQLTIGQTKPVYVQWNIDRSAVYVVTQDNRKFIARLDGSITEVTDAVGGVMAVGWETGWLPPMADGQ